MSDFICLPKIHLIIILILFIGFIVWTVSNNNSKVLVKVNDTIINTIKNTMQKNNEIMKQKQYMRDRDRQVLRNPMTAPERRVPEYQYPDVMVRSAINIPSRGYPENYQLLGMVMRDNTESAYKLFGRQTYPGSSQYEYYVIGASNTGVETKIPITNNGMKEIYDNDIIKIPGTNKTRGEFKVKLYNYDLPRYIPSVFF